MNGIDATKPMLLGYINGSLTVNDNQALALEREFSRFALAEGYSMGFTHVERSASVPVAFEALIASVNKYEAPAVILPSLHHFVILGSMRMAELFEKSTRARVLVLPPSP